MSWLGEWISLTDSGAVRWRRCIYCCEPITDAWAAVWGVCCVPQASSLDEVMRRRESALGQDRARYTGDVRHAVIERAMLGRRGGLPGWRQA